MGGGISGDVVTFKSALPVFICMLDTLVEAHGRAIIGILHGSGQNRTKGIVERK